jgi:hypothetical protein
MFSGRAEGRLVKLDLEITHMRKNSTGASPSCRAVRVADSVALRKPGNGDPATL